MAKQGRLFGTIVERERERRGWTQQYVAEQLGIENPNTVSRWERGKNMPQRSLHNKLSLLFGMSLEELGLREGKRTEEGEQKNHEDVLTQTQNDQISSLQNGSLLAHAIQIEPQELLVNEPRNPYKGLRAFDDDDADDFFGRDELVSAFIEKLKGLLSLAPYNVDIARFMAILGPSGVGKSSVVRAGLLPRLRNGGIPGSEEWLYLPPITPGKHPLSSLKAMLASALARCEDPRVAECLRDTSERGLQQLLIHASGAVKSKAVLVIDQFEELFTQTSDERERQQFIDLLVSASTIPHGTIIVLVVMRADFYDCPMKYPTLGRLITLQQASVFSLDLVGLQQVIEQPAQLPDVGVIFESHLVTNMLRDVQGQRAALPLLQCMLEQLFVRRSGHTLTLKAYDEIGGVRGALSRQAELTYQELPTEEHRRLARVLFLRLIVPGTMEQATTRRRASLADFVFNDTRQSEMMREVIEMFTSARLLVKDRRGAKQNAADMSSEGDDAHVLVEMSHEALLLEWKRMADWVHEFRWDTHLQQHINKDAEFWAHRKHRDRLYRGIQLGEAQAWAKRNIPNQRESMFLRAALARQQRVRLMRAFFTLVVIVALFPLVSSLFGYHTFLSSPILPGGWWISPQSGGTFDDILHLAAYAYPGAPTEPAITYVEFTARWGNTTPWETLCHISSHTPDNVFQCTIDLTDLKAVAGIIRISFNVYDEHGNVHDAPNGVHLITYAPSAKMRASPSKCPWETKTSQI